MPSGPSLLNERDNVQIAPVLDFNWIDMSIAMPSAGWIGTLHSVGRDDFAAGLVREQVDGMRGVVPKQMIGPRARLAQRIHVGAAKEIRLHVHLLDRELARNDSLVHPLVARVEAARVADHRNLAGLFLESRDLLGVREAVGQRNLDLDVLARLEAGDRLCGVHLRGRAQDDGVDLRQREAVGEIAGDVADAVLGRDLLRLREFPAHDGDHFNTVDQLDRVEVLGAERAGAGKRDLDRCAHWCAPTLATKAASLPPKGEQFAP